MNGSGCTRGWKTVGLMLGAAMVLVPAMITPAQAAMTIWALDPAVSGSWYTASNWSSGVPQAGYYIEVTNGGTAIISGAAAYGRQLTISGNSTVRQNGSTLTLNGASSSPSLTVSSGLYRLNAGTLVVTNSIQVASSVNPGFYQGNGNVQASGQHIHMGYGSGSLGHWDLAGSGAVACDKLTLGYYGTGYFTQAAGTVTASEVSLGSWASSGGRYSHGEYTMTGGSLNTGTLTVGYAGSALFHQGGGTVTSTSRLDVGFGIYGYEVGPRRYELAGGTVNSASVSLGAAVNGEFLQTGGTHNTGYLHICASGDYGYTGGALNVQGGIRLEGDLDFGGQARILSLTNSVVDFGQGNILNASLASVVADTHTLIILPTGFDPDTFSYFSANPLVQTADTTVVIPAGRSIVGWGQIDEHVQCAGSLTASSKGFLSLTNGLALSNNASVELRTGTLTVENTESGMTSGTLRIGALTIGDEATGSFTQSGGSFTVANDVYLGYESRGTGTFNQTSGSCAMKKRVILGYKGAAEVNQSGGSNTITGDLYFGYLNYGNGSYTLSGSGSLTAPNEYLGWQSDGQGTFHQTGGVHNVTSKMVLGNNHRGTFGEYTLDGGTLTTGYTSVGERGLGRFAQSGGTHTIANTLSVGPYSSPSSTNRGGTYTMSGGTLTVGTLQIGGSSSDSGVGGTFEILGPSSVRVSKTLYLGRRGTFNAVPGSEIHLAGGSLDIQSTDAAALGGLANLHLTVDGGASKLSQLEAASQDMGATIDGFNANFALDAIQIDGGSAARLVNARDNRPLWTGSEAVYVNWLILESGSSLDLNGLNLYCLNYADNGGTVTLNGGQLAVIPEPLTLGLMGAGLVGLLARRRE